MTGLQRQVTSVLRNVRGREPRAQLRFVLWPVFDRATAFDRNGLRRAACTPESGDLRSEQVRGQQTRAQPRPAHNGWRPTHKFTRTQHRISEFPVNLSADDLTLRLRELETLSPLLKTLHKFPACFPNSSFGLDARCRLCIVSPMKC